MLKKGLKSVFYLGFLAVLLASCSEFRQLQKSDDWKAKYEGAMRYYEAGDYYRAIALFEEILPVTRGKAEGEEAQFYYAYAHYNDNQFILSSHYFKSFYETYSRSPLANEAQFMYAYSLYQSSPVYNLDQTSTKEAIVAFQVFINRNAGSKYVTEANQILSELQVKLETKDYHSAKLYHKIGILMSAITAFDNFAINYPDSRFNEELQYLKIESSFQMAQNSIPSKKEGRFRDVVELYEEYIEDYPESSWITQAGKYYDQSLNQIEKLEKLI